MNKPIFTLIMAALALGASAQCKLDPSARSIMQEYRMMQEPGDKARSRVRPSATVAAATRQEPMAMTLITDTHVTEQALQDAGFEVLVLKDNIAIVRGPLGCVTNLEAIPGVIKISFGKKQDFHMNIARKSTHTDMVHNGSSDPNGVEIQPYTGKGVLLGIIDIGIDPNHINFLDEEGNSRFAKFYHMMGDYGAHDTYSGEELAKFQTDYRWDLHGTHTAGIAGGGYRGPIDYYDENDEDMEDVPNPFYGGAPEATLLGSGGELYDDNISMGLWEMNEYAKKAGMPLVVNMSFGSNLGPHDGTSSLCQSMTTLGEGAIMCVSAGNEGDTKMSVTKTFDGTNSLKTCLDFQRGGEVHCEFWGDDSTPFDMTLAVVDNSGNILFEVPVSKTGQTVMGSSVYDNAHSDASFDRGFYTGSYISAVPNVDPANNRYMVDLQYEMMRNSGVNYHLGIIVKGEDGHRVWGYVTSYYNSFTNNGFRGWDDGSKNGSISDLSTAEGVISIGAYADRDHMYMYSGDIEDNSNRFAVGDYADFSSFGTLMDGRTLPHVTAPGVHIVSSVSRYYNVEKVDADKGMVYNPGARNYVALTRQNKNLYLWQNLSGTSMASPVAAGIMALWAQANPDLTYKQILEQILPETCIVDDWVKNSWEPERWGYGKIDAIAGLKKALQLTSVINPVAPGTDDDLRLIVSAKGNNTYEAFVNGENGLTATLTSMSGANVLNAVSDTDTVTVDASSMTPGIYVLTVKGADTNYSRKIVIR